MPDDDRMRSSKDYLDRRSDLFDFVNTQAATRDAVYDGIIEGDDFKVRSALAITSSVSGSFDAHLESLIRALQSSPLPDAERWVERLKGIARRSEAQRVLHEFATLYDGFYQLARDGGHRHLESEKDQIVRDVRALWEMVGGR